jgi:hypothetical membrane protein
MDQPQRAGHRWLLGHYRYFGMAGSLAVVLGMLAAMIPYSGRQGEPFSILNHYISELGQWGVSQGAWAFNAGLVLGGLLFIPFVIGLGLVLEGLWSTLGMVAGVAAAAGAALVGLFPMNALAAHIQAAMLYFRSGLLMMLLFGIAILRQPPGSERIDRRVNWAGLLSALAYAAFLAHMELAGAGALDPARAGARPAVSLLVVLEWAVFFSTVAWFFVVAAGDRHRP